MRSALGLLGAVVILTGAPGHAAAAVTISFTGVIAADLIPPILVETPFSGSITYDEVIADSSEVVGFGYFLNAVTGFQLEVGGALLDSGSVPFFGGDIRVTGNSFSAQIVFGGSPVSFLGDRLSHFEFVLGGPDGSVPNPDVLADLRLRALAVIEGEGAGVALEFFQLNFNGRTENGLFTTVTPIPATLPLLAAGVGGLGWMAARRRRTAA